MILLDTHIWIWWVSQQPQLTPSLAQIIAQHQTDGLGVSSVEVQPVRIIAYAYN